jgi:ABC-type dipeptide/oligopeptide/nickel transport system permease subunit
VTDRSTRWSRFGWAVLLAVVSACVLTLPWTFGHVQQGAASEPRYAASNLSLNLLPPTWMAMDDFDAHRLERAEGTPAYVPGRALGTDASGRDFLARLLAGGVFSLSVGLASAAIAVVIGTLWGAVAGFVGGRTDAILMRIVDVLYGLPSVLLVVLLAVAVDGVVGRSGRQLSPGQGQLLGLVTLLVAIGGTSWLTMSRVIRGQVLSLRAQPFMEGCRAIGVPAWKQFVRHLLPNLVGPIVVYATLAVPAAILSESFLSFLGIGVREPTPSWGSLASDGLSQVNLVHSRWWLLVAPCVLIAATLVALNFIGDSLRARFDPTANRARW